MACTGIWVPVHIEDPNGIYSNLILPSQWGEILPEFNLLKDGSAVVLDENRKELAGFWNIGTDEGQIDLNLENGQVFNFAITDEGLRTRYSFRDGELLNLLLKPKESATLQGTWAPVLQTRAAGNYWAVPQRTATLSLNDDMTGKYIVDDGTGQNERTVEWERNGNDLILYVRGKFENGAEGSFPFRFYQLRDGLLLEYEQRDGNWITFVYGKQGEAENITEVSSLRPLLNTAWELFAREIKGVRIPISVYGEKAEEYLMFFSKGNGGLIHTENGEQTSLKCTCMLVDGSLTLNFKGNDPVICQYADSDYLVRKIGNGEKLYYRRKLIPQAMGIPEGETTPLDLAVDIPADTVISVAASIKLSAVFSDPVTVNSQKGNDLVSWSVTGTDGNAVDGVSILDDGTLITDSAISSPVEVVIHAKSISYGTEASCFLMINPAK